MLQRTTLSPPGSPAALSRPLHCKAAICRARSLAVVRASGTRTATVEHGKAATLLDTEQHTRAAPALDKASLYNQNMSQQMGWDPTLNPYEYHPQRGLYYHAITPVMLVGSQPQKPDDIDTLKHQAGVSHILNLQEDKDMKYWGVDVRQLSERAAQLDVQLVRTPARDFDPHSLRRMLPKAVAALERAKQSGGKVYVHCTAGLGRSPAVAIASLYWFGGMQLDEAYKFLTQIRPCGPKRDAIRAATYDLLDHRDWDTFQHLPSHAWSCLSEEQKRVIQEKVMALAPAL